VAEINFDDPYPNPFNPVTTFDFALPRPTWVTLEVYNILGQKVATLTDQEYPAGRHKVAWDTRATGGNEIASGVYFARIKAGEFKASRKMVVVK
jgi:flagellar hook assembly protein FlgD